VSEAEIIHLGLPFGRVTNVLVLKGKNQVSADMPILIRLSALKLGTRENHREPFNRPRHHLTFSIAIFTNGVIDIVDRRAISATKTINDASRRSFQALSINYPRRAKGGPRATLSSTPLSNSLDASLS